MAFWRPGSIGPQRTNEYIDHDTREEIALVLHNPLHALPLNIQRQRLPIYAHRDEILYALELYQTVILVGATGTGKTTQIPQYLMECGWTKGKRMVAVTQPRKTAVVAMAHRVAIETQTKVGAIVGYHVDFDCNFMEDTTKIMFISDTILLRETINDPLLSKYSVIMVDEAHERTLATDVLIALVKKIQLHRPNLRLIIASATLDVDSFIDFFQDNKKPVNSDINTKNITKLKPVVAVSVEGRQYPVEIQYLMEPCSDYLQKSIETVLAILSLEDEVGSSKHSLGRRRYHNARDIMVFLPSYREIDFVVAKLRESAPLHVVLLPLYGALSIHTQQQVFMPAEKLINSTHGLVHAPRKVVVASSIADTAVTIDGVGFVVDSCFTMSEFLNPFTGIESRQTVQISQATARQRAGRAGRTNSGKCFRLITEEDFSKVPKHSMSEIQRRDVTSVVLQLLVLGIHDIAHFDFLDSPSPESIIRSFETLVGLGITDTNLKLNQALANVAATSPLSPNLAKAVVYSIQLDCVEEMLSVASVLSLGNIEDLFLSRRKLNSMDPGKREDIEQAQKKLQAKEGDHITYINIVQSFMEQNEVSHRHGREWCSEHGLHFGALCGVLERRAHLKGYIRNQLNNWSKSNSQELQLDSQISRVLKSLIAGYFFNVARLMNTGQYVNIRDSRHMALHQTCVYTYSSFSRNLPQWVIYHESIQLATAQHDTLGQEFDKSPVTEYMLHVSEINPKWLLETAPNIYRSKDAGQELSGDSGKLGLPRNKLEKANDAPERILFRKPKPKDTTKAPTLPIHIGKRKGGLRSQF